MAKKSSNQMKKWFITSLIFFVILGSSIVIVHADEGISTLLSKWFQQQKETMSSNLNEEIEKEKQLQASRIEEELTKMLQHAEKDLTIFTEEQINIHLKKLEDYADQLINDFDVDHHDEQEEIQKDLEKIVQSAKQTMEQVLEEKANDKKEIKD